MMAGYDKPHHGLTSFFLPLSIVLNAALASAQPSTAPNRQLASKQLNEGGFAQEDDAR
jgi:hypothetical protein